MTIMLNCMMVRKCNEWILLSCSSEVVISFYMDFLNMNIFLFTTCCFVYRLLFDGLSNVQHGFIFEDLILCTYHKGEIVDYHEVFFVSILYHYFCFLIVESGWMILSVLSNTIVVVFQYGIHLHHATIMLLCFFSIFFLHFELNKLKINSCLCVKNIISDKASDTGMPDSGIKISLLQVITVIEHS